MHLTAFQFSLFLTELFFGQLTLSNFFTQLFVDCRKFSRSLGHPSLEFRLGVGERNGSRSFLHEISPHRISTARPIRICPTRMHYVVGVCPIPAACGNPSRRG